MKAPEVKNPRSGFHATVLSLELAQVLPSSCETPSQVSISLLPGSLRLSNQIAKNVPAGSDVTQEKNWSFFAGSPSEPTATKRASDHVAPPSVDVWTEISAPLTLRLMLFWYMNARVPVAAFQFSDGAIGARNFLFGSRSPGSGLSRNWPGLSIR